MTEELQREIAELNEHIEHIEDPRASYALVQSRIADYRRTDVDIPEDLVMLERCLFTECMAESQGR